MSNKNLVSIVIPTRNEERNIEDCLKSIEEQSYPRDSVEVLVVDKDSPDKTREIAGQYADRVYNIEDYKGDARSYQRNFGVKKAQGNYVIILDADMRLGDRLLEQCIKKINSDPSLIGLYIPELIVGDSYWCEVRRFERSFYNATVVDAFRFIRREDFLAVGGFDENLFAAEDWDLDKRIKERGRIGIIDEPLFHDEGEFKIWDYVKKKAYYSQNFDKYFEKWGKDDPDVQKQFSFYYRYIGIFVEDGKWKKLISKPHLALGMFFLRFLVGLVFITRNLRKFF